MPNEKILVVEDETDILELITYNLKKEGYQVTGAVSGEEAIKLFPQVRPDLVVLDLMLPGVDGLDVCKWIKREHEDTHVLILTARDGEADIVTGLELGADDYVSKPFSPRILSARVKAIIRRGKSKAPSTDSVLNLGDIYVHPGKREVKIEDQIVTLTNLEFRVLHFLGSRKGWAFTRAQIVSNVRGEDFAVTDRSVDTLVVGLRKKMGNFSHCIETVRGVGYRFKE